MQRTMSMPVSTTRIALVIGANRGIRFATVRGLAGAGVGTLPRELDVTDQATIRRLADEVRATYGRLDVLMNNAALLYDRWQSALQADLEVVRETMETKGLRRVAYGAAIQPFGPCPGLQMVAVQRSTAAGVWRREHDQQSQILHDIDEAVSFASGYVDQVAGRDRGLTRIGDDAGAAGGHEVDLVFAVGLLVVHCAGGQRVGSGREVGSADVFDEAVLGGARCGVGTRVGHDLHRGNLSRSTLIAVPTSPEKGHRIRCKALD